MQRLLILILVKNERVYKNINKFLSLSELFWRWGVEAIWSRGRIASQAASASRNGAGTTVGSRMLLRCRLLLLDVVVRGLFRWGSVHQRGAIGGTKEGGGAQCTRRRSAPRARVPEGGRGGARGATRHPIARRGSESRA